MDRVSLLLVQNIAFTDIVISLVFYLPTLVTLLGNKWVIGEFGCLIIALFFNTVPFVNEILCITLLSVYRVWMLIYQPTARTSINFSHTVMFAVLMWIIPLFMQLGYVIGGIYAYFQPNILNCEGSYFANSGITIYTMVILCVFLIIPMIIIITTNVNILYIVTKHSRKVGKCFSANNATAITISSICWGFILSYCPTLIIYCLVFAGAKIPIWFHIFQNYARAINIVVNPLIYSITNACFRRYLRCLCTLGSVEEHEMKNIAHTSTAERKTYCTTNLHGD